MMATNNQPGLNLIGKSNLFICLWLLNTIVGFAQELPPGFSINSFLLSEDVAERQSASCMAQDSVGFLWFGTANWDRGLIKYDGNSFTSYGNDPKDSTSITSDAINVIYVDRSHRIWIGTMKGLNLYNPYEDNFQQFFHDPQDSQTLGHNHIRNIIEDDDGYIWVGTPYGINRYDPSTGKFKRFLNIFGAGKEDLWEDPYKMLVAKDGTLWVAFRTHEPKISGREHIDERVTPLRNGKSVLSRFDKEKQTFVHYWPEEDNPYSHSGNFISTIMEDSKGNFWVGGLDHELYLFDRQRGDFISEGILPPFSVNTKGKSSFKSNNYIQFIFEDQDGKLWIEDENVGIRYYDPITRKSLLIDVNPTSDRFSDVAHIMQSKDGSIWTLNTEIKKISVPRQMFISHPIDQTALPSDITFNRIYSFVFYENQDGEIWANCNYGKGDENGLMWVSKDRKEVKHYPPSPNGLQRGIITSLFQDSRGFVWISNISNRISSGTNLLYKFDPKTEEFEQILGGPKAGIRNIQEDKKGNIWLVTGGEGLFCLNPQTKTFKNYQPLTPDSASYNYNFMDAMIFDAKGKIWIGGGTAFLWRNSPYLSKKSPPFISHFDPQTGKFETYDVPHGNPNITHIVHSININSKGELWLAASGGIFQFDHSQKTFTKEISLSNLGMKAFKKMHIDSEDYFWIAGVNSLFLFSQDLEKILRFNPSHGMDIIPHFLGGFPAKSESGHFFLGDYGEYYEFSSRDVKNILASKPARVNLTEFRLANETVRIGEGSPLDRPIWETQSMTLTYDQNVFDFRFSGVDYEHPDQNIYLYKLENFDDDWRNAGKELQASYVKVPPGRYTFRVKGKNSYGQWSAETTVEVLITPPWWATTWAYAIYVLIGLGMIIGLFYLQRRNHQRKLGYERQVNDELRRLDQLKDQFLANTSHELKTPLHGMVGLAESLQEKLDDQEDHENLSMIIASGKRLSSLVNDLLDFSKVKNHDLRLAPKSLNLRPAVELVLQACYPLLGQKNIRLQNEVPKELQPVLMDENRLQQILFNLIGNAIKFTEKGKILVFAHKQIPPHGDGDMIVMGIEDTGIGIPKSKWSSIFNAFEQIDIDSNKRAASGTGLGLAITRQLVELHGGKMWIESEEGRGSTFFVSLPIAVSKAVNGTITPKPSSKLFNLSQRQNEEIKKHENIVNEESENKTNLSSSVTQILIVDDEPINHQVIKNFLRDKELVIHSAMNGNEGLEMIRSGKIKYDLVLLDVMMPRMSGYEVCQQLRKEYLPSEMPVIMVTAKSQISDMIHGLETGANDYISKPFSKDEFLARIKTHLNLHTIHRATHKFVPKDFLRSIGRDAITDVKLGDQRNQRQTIFFSDIRDYTSLAEQMSSDDAFAFVNAYAGRMGPIIQDNAGFVNQYLGDGIMAIFPEDAHHALQAGIEMQRSIEKYNEERRLKKRVPIAVGMGMHSGELIMGVIGDANRNDPATISDTVNTASRMEGLTKHFGTNILLSEHSVAQLGNDHGFNLRYLGLVRVKGRVGAVGIYECLEGLPSEKMEATLSQVDVFEAGMKHYFSRNFKEAVLAFEEVSLHNPKDKPTQLYLARSKSYQLAGVPGDWIGIETMSFK